MKYRNRRARRTRRARERALNKHSNTRPHFRVPSGQFYTEKKPRGQGCLPQGANGSEPTPGMAGNKPHSHKNVHAAPYLPSRPNEKEQTQRNPTMSSPVPLFRCSAVPLVAVHQGQKSTGPGKGKRSEQSKKTNAATRNES